MVAITAVVPTLNRPELLREALRSLQQQTLPPDEIIVVDDGSTPAVDQTALRAEFGHQLRVLRNEKSRGLAYGRNWGVEQANGKYVVHLDDDDLLASTTLKEAYRLLATDPSLEVVFLGVEGFGPRAAHFNKVQPEAIRKVRNRVPHHVVEDRVLEFDDELMRAMLKAVPAAFQCTMMRRETWQKVSELRFRAYQTGTGARSIDEAKALITGQLRDSEWAIYAAAICRKTALLDAPRYLFRCEGQNLASRTANVEKHLLQNLHIKAQLFRASSVLPELLRWKRDIRKGFADTLADAAYHHFQQGRRLVAWKYAWSALRVRPSFARLRLTLRICFPRSTECET